MENSYTPHSYHYCTDSYKEPDSKEEWLPCPKCKLTPKVWVFDNGEHSACGCWESKYEHFDVQADETIGQVVSRTGGFVEYDADAHRRKWNAYCQAASVNTTQLTSKG